MMVRKGWVGDRGIWFSFNKIGDMVWCVVSDIYLSHLVFVEWIHDEWLACNYLDITLAPLLCWGFGFFFFKKVFLLCVAPIYIFQLLNDFYSRDESNKYS